MIKVPSMQDLLEAGAHFGHKVSRGNPKSKRYIFGARDGVHIIDLEISERLLKAAATYAFDLGKAGKTLLVVGTKKQAREIVEELSKEANCYYLTSHWVGGLLTNFDEIRKNLRKILDLKKEQVEGTLTRYTKKEQLLIARKIEKYDREVGGLSLMTQLPDALFVLDIVADSLAVSEATRLGIPVIAVCDTNSNPDPVDYPIPANDDGIKSIKIVAEAVINAYRDGLKLSAGKVESDEKPVAASSDEVVVTPVVEEAAVIEEEIEKQVVNEQARKVE